MPKGLFLQRQEEVSKEFATFMTEELLTPKKIWNEIAFGMYVLAHVLLRGEGTPEMISIKPYFYYSIHLFKAQPFLLRQHLLCFDIFDFSLFFIFEHILCSPFLSSSSSKGPKSAALRTAITEELRIELSLLFYKINPDHWAGISDRIATALPQAAVSSYPYIKEVRKSKYHSRVVRRGNF